MFCFDAKKNAAATKTRRGEHSTCILVRANTLVLYILDIVSGESVCICLGVQNSHRHTHTQRKTHTNQCVQWNKRNLCQCACDSMIFFRICICMCVRAFNLNYNNNTSHKNNNNCKMKRIENIKQKQRQSHSMLNAFFLLGFVCLVESAFFFAYFISH